MVTATEKTKLHDLDRQIRSLVHQKETVKKAKEKKLLELDWEIKKCTGKILKILKSMTIVMMMMMKVLRLVIG